MKYTLQIFSMAADTGDFRSSARLLLVKRLSQATCCTAHIMPNSVIFHSMHGKAKKKKKKGQICRWQSENTAHLRVCIHRPCDGRCEKTFEGQTRDLSISLSTSDLISHSAVGVASFICLHNCRPACRFVWHMLVESAARSLSRRRRRR